MVKRRKYVYYTGNWVQLNTVGSVIWFSQKTQRIWSSQRLFNYYLNCLGRTHHFFIRDGNALIYLRMTNKIMGCPRGVMVKAMNCGIVVREFVLQSLYYVHFRANTLGKGMNPPYSPSSLWVNSRTD